jgi:hypothetical protein
LITIIIIIVVIVSVHEGVVFSPLHVADHSLGVHGRAFVSALLIRDIVIEADVVGANTHRHLIPELE